MPSPFPGVDPYLESSGLWPDFHSRFINAWSESLSERLPDNYEARIDERMRVVQRSLDEARDILPDISVERRPGPPSQSRGTIATLEPVIVARTVREEQRETRIHILRRSDRELVAVLELLSPTNKDRNGHVDYELKRSDIFNETDAHLVELDLLLAGQRPEMGEALPPGHFYAIVSRANRSNNSQVYAWTLRDPLPAIPIPLRAPDPDITIELAPVFATAYERGRYARSINYSVPPNLSLATEELDWAAARAKAAVG
jgi:hypothetical protein